MKTLLTTLALAALTICAVNAEEKKTEKKAELCPVSGEELGSMGKPYVIQHQGKEVKLCCKSCEKDFKKNPDKYLKKIEGKK
ncbi:MAG TPA: TRASH domain-containing protein [Verrucomicrobiae bacterium]